MNKIVGQRFQVNDRVRKINRTGFTKELPTGERIGTIKKAKKVINRVGRTSYYYEIQWDNLKSVSTHHQQVLSLIEPSD